jgi:hypothetical protein
MLIPTRIAAQTAPLMFSLAVALMTKDFPARFFYW